MCCARLAVPCRSCSCAAQGAIESKRASLAAQQAALEEVLADGINDGLHPLERPDIAPEVKVGREGAHRKGVGSV